jgi:hypothetical protein
MKMRERDFGFMLLSDEEGMRDTIDLPKTAGMLL